MRAGGIFGVHKIYAVSDEEQITFEHTALNRTVFARGALVGARWILNNSKNGVYTMDDVIS
jgi:4-hydroxy-tetrahydrodipicolinate reductase